MRGYAKKDDNHVEIVKYFRSKGYFVHDIAVLKNCADLVVTKNGKTFYVEVKDGSKPACKKKLTEGEEKFRSDLEKFGGMYFVIESTSDIDNLML